MTEPSNMYVQVSAILGLANRLHFQLGPAAQAWFGEGTHSSGEAALLKNLSDLGPKTVPDLAAMRPTSRQFIQGLVDNMAAKGLVEFCENPQHKKSKLVALTTHGRKTGETLHKKWTAAMKRLSRNLDASNLSAAERLLEDLVNAIEQDTKL